VTVASLPCFSTLTPGTVKAWIDAEMIEVFEVVGSGGKVQEKRVREQMRKST